VKILLDTHCWLWMLGAQERFSSEGLASVTAPANELVLSAGSAWEIAIKYALGDRPPARVARRPAPTPPSGPVRPNPHRAGAVEGFPILTSDPTFAPYDVELLTA
jgi:hypothetical protein